MKATKYTNMTIFTPEDSDPPYPSERELKLEWGDGFLSVGESFDRIELTYAPDKDSFAHYHIELTKESTRELRDYLDQLLKYIDVKNKAYENAETINRESTFEDYRRGKK